MYIELYSKTTKTSNSTRNKDWNKITTINLYGTYCWWWFKGNFWVTCVSDNSWSRYDIKDDSGIQLSLVMKKEVQKSIDYSHC